MLTIKINIKNCRQLKSDNFFTFLTFSSSGVLTVVHGWSQQLGGGRRRMRCDRWAVAVIVVEWSCCRVTRRYLNGHGKSDHSRSCHWWPHWSNVLVRHDLSQKPFTFKWRDSNHNAVNRNKSWSSSSAFAASDVRLVSGSQTSYLLTRPEILIPSPYYPHDQSLPLVLCPMKKS